MLTCSELVPIMEMYYNFMISSPPNDVKYWWFFNCMGMV